MNLWNEMLLNVFVVTDTVSCVERCVPSVMESKEMRNSSPKEKIICFGYQFIQIWTSLDLNFQEDLMFECVSYSENLIMGRLKVVIILRTVHYWGIAVLSFNVIAEPWICSFGQCGCTYCDRKWGREWIFSRGSGIILVLTGVWFCSDTIHSPQEVMCRSPIRVPWMAFGSGGAASYSGDRSPHERTRTTLQLTMDFTVKPIDLRAKSQRIVGKNISFHFWVSFS